MHKLDSVPPLGERRGGQLQRVRVAIDAQHAPGPGFNEGPRVPAEADRAIHEEPAALRGKRGQNLRSHHGNVYGHRTAPGQR